jgi:hypothetical protein
MTSGKVAARKFFASIPYVMRTPPASIARARPGDTRERASAANMFAV